MKYLATTLLVFSFFWVLAQREFAPIGAEWYYEKNASFNPPVFGYVKHKCIKDSIIEGQTVKVLEITHSPNDYTTNLLGYEYLLQKGDTILYWKSGEFHVLYNFSLQKGDSILLYSEMQNQCKEKTNYGWNRIDSTYTLTINNKMLKAYSATAVKGSIWGWDQELPIYEVIGSQYYLLPQNVFCGYYDGFPQYGCLRCYNDDYLGFIRFDSRMVCDSTTNYPVGFELFSKKHLVSVFPNPADTKINIELNALQETGILKAEIFDIVGNKKAENWVEGCKTSIDLSTLPKGFYILFIKLNEKIIDYEKFTKE